MKYIIKKDGITIGRFENEQDCKDAFNQYVKPISSNCFIMREE